jgi:hypothetical protein
MKTTLSLVIALLFSQAAHAQIFASPSYQDVGTARAMESRMAFVTFTNMSSNTYQGVNVFCSGSFGVFSCSSSCFQLQPHGSCSVYVTFRPQSNDGMRQSVTLNLSGMGAFASATVTGTDASPMMLDEVNVNEDSGESIEE